MGVTERETREAFLKAWEFNLSPEHVSLSDFLRMFKIEGAGGDLVPFDFNVIQVRLDAKIRELEESFEPVRILILKARQEGCSTYCDGRLFERVVRQPGQKCLIMCDDEDSTSELYDSKVRELWGQIPAEVRPEERRSNRMELAIQHGTSRGERRKEFQFRCRGRSYVRVMTAGKKTGGRSRTLQHLHGSEVAFWRNPEEVLDATLQCIHDKPGTSVILETTANGASGVFYDLWQDAVAGRNNYIPMFFPWHDFPEYTRPFADEEDREEFEEGKLDADLRLMQGEHGLTMEQVHWYHHTLWNRCRGDKIRMMVEYPSTPEEAFISSGTCRFDRKALYALERKKVPYIGRGRIVRRSGEWTFLEDPEGPVQLYRKPVPGREYLLGADTAAGIDQKGRDYSTAVIYDRRARKLMARISLRVEPRKFGEELRKLGLYFDECLLGVESNQHGITALRRLQQLQYPRIYREKKVDSATGKVTDRLGYWTGAKNRDHAINCLASEIALERMELCKEQILECRSFVQNDSGKWEARPGSHDDEVTALWVLAAINFETPYEPMEKDPEPEPEPTRIEEWEDRMLAEMSQGDIFQDQTLGSEW